MIIIVAVVGMYCSTTISTYRHARYATRIEFVIIIIGAHSTFTSTFSGIVARGLKWKLVAHSFVEVALVASKVATICIATRDLGIVATFSTSILRTQSTRLLHNVAFAFPCSRPINHCHWHHRPEIVLDWTVQSTYLFCSQLLRINVSSLGRVMIEQILIIYPPAITTTLFAESYSISTR